MKIIAIKWRSGSSDFVHVAVNGDGNEEYKALKKADKQGLFDIAVFSPDTFQEALDYVKHENSSKGVSAL